MVSGVFPSPPGYVPSVFIARKVQHSQRLVDFHRMLVTHAFALSASHFVHKKMVPTNLYEYALGGTRTYEIDLYCRHEDNLLGHRGDRQFQLLISCPQKQDCDSIGLMMTCLVLSYREP